MERIITGAVLFVGEDLTEVNGISIWMRDGKIHKLIKDEAIPHGVEIIDRKGFYIIPGLIDLHVHIMWDGSPDPVSTHEKESHEQRLIRSVINCQTYIKAGITTIRDLGSINNIALDVAEAVNRMLFVGPRVIASGKTITMTGGHDPFWGNFADGPFEVLKATREQIYNHAKVIKVSATGGVYGRTDGEVAENSELSFDELRVICEEAHKFGLKVASHAIGREGIENSIRAGVDSIEHGHYLDDDLIRLMIEKETSWVPTLYIYEQIAKVDGVPDYAQRKARKITERHVQAFSRYFKSGLVIGAGSDAGSCYAPHPSLVEELETMKKYTESNIEILKTATSNAGKILGLNVGQIAEGFEADLIVLSENPVQNIHSLKTIEEVYKEGNVVAT